MLDLYETDVHNDFTLEYNKTIMDLLNTPCMSLMFIVYSSGFTGLEVRGEKPKSLDCNRRRKNVL